MCCCWRKPHRQYQHPLCRAAGRAGAVCALGADPLGRGRVPRVSGLLGGFRGHRPDLADISRKSLAGSAPIQAVPLGELLQCVQARIESDPAALLCASPDCPRCQAVRARLQCRSELIF